MKPIHRTHKFRLYPTPDQEKRLRSWCAGVRWVYNAALEQRNMYGRGKAIPDWDGSGIARGPDPFDRPTKFYGRKQKSEVTGIINDPDLGWIGDSPSDCRSAAFDDLEKAFQNVYAGRARYPSWRKAGENESLCFEVWKGGEPGGSAVMHDGKAWRAAVVVGKDSVKFPKIGRIAYKKHRKIKGRMRQAIITCDAGRWHVCIVCEVEVRDTPPVNNLAVGIDVGVATPFMLSTGEPLPFEKTPEKLAKRQKRLQRDLARARKGSNRRRRIKAKVAKVTRRIAERRKAQLHKITTGISRDYGKVVIEDLRLKNMTKSAKGTVDKPGKNVSQKAGLNRSILDVSPGLFRELLTWKMKDAGGALTAVDPKNTSRACAGCGAIDKGSRRSQAVFECVHCGHADHADINAAINILNRGMLEPGSVAGPGKTPSEPLWRPATSKSHRQPLAGRDSPIVFEDDQRQVAFAPRSVAPGRVQESVK